MPIHIINNVDTAFPRNQTVTNFDQCSWIYKDILLDSKV